MINVSSIKSNPNNPRKVKLPELNKLVRSIQEFPEMMRLRPLVVDENGIVLGGNQRLAAIKKIGMTEIPDDWVVRADSLTDEQKRRFITADNVSFGDWDLELLKEEWAGELDALKDLFSIDIPIPNFQEVNQPQQDDKSKSVQNDSNLPPAPIQQIAPTVYNAQPPQSPVSYANKNIEVNVSDFKPTVKLVFELSVEQYSAVKKKLFSVSENLEEALCKILGV